MLPEEMGGAGAPPLVAMKLPPAGYHLSAQGPEAVCSEGVVLYWLALSIVSGAEDSWLSVFALGCHRSPHLLPSTGPLQSGIEPGGCL